MYSIIYVKLLIAIVTITSASTIVHPQRTPKTDTGESLPAGASRMASSLNKFSNRLYNTMNEYKQEEYYSLEAQPSSNDLIYSPLSIFNSLATLRSGSGSLSHQELSTVLSLSRVNDTVVEQGVSGILHTYDSEANPTVVKVLNRLFLDHSYHPDTRYHQIVHDKFNGEIVQTGFSNATAASEFVNAHVYQASNGVLQDIISVDLGSTDSGVTENSVNGSAVEPQQLSIDGGLMLISGMTLEGDWARPFTPMLTNKATFTREDGSVSQIDMMHRDGIYEYAEIEELNATALSIPYKSHRFSLNVLLPEESVSIAELEENIEAFPCIAVMSRFKKTYVQVSLPRFQVETTVDLIDPLEKMGVKRVFSEEAADLGKLVQEDGGLFLTNAVHKSVLQVSEGGSRVRGANFVEAVPAQARILTPFTVNRPFVFFIADRLLNTVVLVGRKAV